jgi:hypothetical protein
MNKKIPFSIAIIIILFSAVLVVYGVTIYSSCPMPKIFDWLKIENNKPVACTQEAKVCPDGSVVGRTGPNCGFAPCPSPKAGKAPCDVCKESDGGKNYYIRGAANPCSSADGSQCPPCGAWVDECLDSNILLEYSCDNLDNLDGEQYHCLNGCKDGACVYLVPSSYSIEWNEALELLYGGQIKSVAQKENGEVIIRLKDGGVVLTRGNMVGEIIKCGEPCKGIPMAIE